MINGQNQCVNINIYFNSVAHWSKARTDNPRICSERGESNEIKNNESEKSLSLFFFNY
jgi:hypothetical protein